MEFKFRNGVELNQSTTDAVKNIEKPSNTNWEKELNTRRNKLDKIDNILWKNIRKNINEYDFFVTGKIINRAFFKYWEIIQKFKLFDNINEKDCIIHTCEAPGGFIQGSNIYLKRLKHKKIIDKDGFEKILNLSNVNIYTISLNKNLEEYKDNNLPNYNDKILTKNVIVTYGCDGSGDINKQENIKYLKQLINNNNNKGYLITADGGFDEGKDFNNKETLHYQLILNEIKSGIYLLKKDGIMILKVFDVFTDITKKMIYLLYIHFNELIVYKPFTSRPTNSEKYLICKGLKTTTDALVPPLLELTIENLDTITLSPFFEEQIQMMNDKLVQNQCNMLDLALHLCNNSVPLDFDLEQRQKTFNNWKTKFNF